MRKARAPCVSSRSDLSNVRRDYFSIGEGVYAGKSASVTARSRIASWLAKPLPTYKAAVSLTFQKGARKLQTPVGEIDAKTQPANPIPNGIHPIQMPDFPHSLGSGYRTRAQKAMTWFYLGAGDAVPGNNDRYLHPGSVSAGCVTVTDVESRDALYQSLILARATGGRNVGTIRVED